MLVKTLVPHSGPAIGISEITVLEGPAGVGKTAALADILRHTTGELPPGTPQFQGRSALRDVQLVSPLTEERLLTGLLVFTESETEFSVAGLDPTYARPLRVPCRKESWNLLRRPVLSAQAVAKSELGELLKLKFAYFTSSQLAPRIATAATANPLEGPQHLLHLLQFASPEVLNELNQSLALLFDGIELSLDDSQFVELSLRVGPRPQVEDPRRRALAYAGLPKIEQTSESLQRCAALMLICLLSPGRVLLLDAPDAGLSPHVARLLGRWLSNRARALEVQLVLAPSTAGLLSGLSEGQGEVTLVRLRPDDGPSRWSPLAPDTLRRVERSPILRANRGGECLTANGILLTETEAERAIYQALVDADAPGDHRIQVVQSFGPGFLLDLLELLKPLGVPVAVLAHLDLLSSNERFQELCRQLTGAESQPAWQAVRERLNVEFSGALDRQALADNTREMEAFLTQLEAKPAEPMSLAAESREAAHRWREVRTRGLAAIPAEMRSEVEELSDQLKSHGLFLSPVGQVRHWFQDGRSPAGTHWFEGALVRIQRGSCPEPLLASFREIMTWVRHQAAHARP